MGGVNIGPLMFSTGHFAIILAGIVFLIATSVMSRLIDGRFRRWSTWAFFVFLAGGRLGHVLRYLDSFALEPLRALAFWDGGFTWETGLAGVILLSIYQLRNLRLFSWALLPIAAGALVAAGVTFELSSQLTSELPGGLFTTLDGQSLDTAVFAGRPVVLNLWATWCPPCREELPMMAAFAKSDPGAVFVFANQGEAPQAIATYLNTQGISLDNAILDPSLAFTRHYQAPGLPVTLFISSEGEVVSYNVGAISKENLLEGIRMIK